MATTPGGLPYPLPSAPVANGAADIRALAEAVDTRTAYRESTGTVTAAVSGSSSFTQAVTFAVGRFTQPPVVSTNTNSGIGAVGGWYTRAISVLAGSFTLFFASSTNPGTFSGVVLQWHAVQMTPAGVGFGLTDVADDDAPPPPTAVVVCPTPGCANEGIAITVQVGWWDGEIWQPVGSVTCGVCGATLEAVPTP